MSLIIAALFAWGLHPQLLVPIGVALGAIVLINLSDFILGSRKGEQ